MVYDALLTSLMTLARRQRSYHLRPNVVTLKSSNVTPNVITFNTFITNINHKGLQRTANEYAKELRIYKDLISKKIMMYLYLILQAEYCNADRTK